MHTPTFTLSWIAQMPERISITKELTAPHKKKGNLVSFLFVSVQVVNF